MGALDGKVGVVTGAGSGVGRAHALLLGAEGVRVVVNDVSDSADETVDLIVGAGGAAVAHRASVSEWSTGEALVETARSEFGDLHIVVNNAGFIRDAMSFSMTEANWQSVVDVHLKGHFVCARAAGAWWREQAKAGAESPRRLIHTSSESGLFGGPAQSNYAPAKGAILTLSVVLARELGKYGVTSNVIAPRARTAMTAGSPVFAEPDSPPLFDIYDPANVAPFVAWLCTDGAGDVNGQAFIVGSDGIWWMQPYSHRRAIRAGAKRWTIAALDAARDDLFADDDTGVPPFAAPTFEV